MTNELTPEKLDAKWREMVAEDNDAAICLMVEMERAEREMHAAREALRDLARFQIYNPDVLKCDTCGSIDRVKKHPSKDSNICWSCYTGI